ncbi:PREDICTED: uncharacterized protein LOC106749107 [Dinoponera quadriceps]|uniref:Uncharacterized protein LOC106749107 n=1 Tax=Dinoponera quadriceps TaxID=609295 RepID=A0A6P3Y0G2_DINQU|nr:PREDICTED: uncharacterized protein LOC106749107 [Dinoponera quadriceps]
MEAPPQSPIEQYYEIQEIEEIPRKIEPSMAGCASKDVAENATYFARCDLPKSNPTSTGRVREETLDNGTELILFLQEEELTKYRQREAMTGRQVIELSDSDCKLALRRHLEMADTVERGEASRSGLDMEMLRKLPPGTIVTKQEQASKADDNSDYKEQTETSSSGGSSSTSGDTAAKVKRIPRAVRNKTRETVQVRRNPTRVSKKDVDKDFPRQPRQQLLVNRREACANYEAGKRKKSSATPYMNTRSVTRKMYTVGATYQAPTKRDETEWKEWPVHGMHERPVYHPQVGLAVEYLGKCFVSLDEKYCEIVDDSAIEVVAIDPRYDRRPASAEKKTAKARKNKRSSNSLVTWNPSASTKVNRSFGTCMHGSLHCVLGYCSQVMAPSGRQATEEEPTVKRPATPAAKTSVSESTKEKISTEKPDRFAEGSKLLEGYAIAMAHSVQGKSTASGRDRAGAVAVGSSAYAPPEAQRPVVEADGSKTAPSNSRTNLPTLRGYPNAPLVLLRSSAAKTGEVYKTKDAFKPAKEPSVNEETLSSIYKLLTANEAAANREATRNSFYTLKRQPASDDRKYVPKRSASNVQLENLRSLRLAKESDGMGSADVKVKPDDRMLTSAAPNVKNRSWCTSEPSEIARILSEYNRGATRKPAIQIYGGASNSAKDLASLATSRHSAGVSCFWRDTTAKENRDVSADRSVGLNISSGRWRKPSVPGNTGDQPQLAEHERTFSGSRGLTALSESCHGASSRERTKPGISGQAREIVGVTRKDLGRQPRETPVIDAKQAVSGRTEDEAEARKTEEECLRELLENTAVLYCAANGIHQDDLSNYINTLDGRQSIQWLETWNNSIV